MGNPKQTGISGLTGKVLYIRHATEAEMTDVETAMKMHGNGKPDLTKADVVVASQANRILGFAVLRREPGQDAGCIDLYETESHRGIGKEVLRHLLDHAQAGEVVADRESGRYLAGMGYERRGDRSAEKRSRVSSFCVNLMGKAAFRYERPGR